MPGTISESYLSRPFTIARSSGRELIFDVMGTADEEEVRSLILSEAPPVYLGLTLESVAGDPVWVDTFAGDGLWKGTARYIYPQSDDEFTFDTSGGTAKITQSFATTRYAPAGGEAPDFDGAINVSEDRVEGVDITIPAYAFSETHRIAATLVDTSYKMLLMSLTGTTNDAPFKGLAEGEGLFMGAAGTRRGDSDYSVTFRFLGSPNVTGMTIGTIDGIDKKGWEYLWVRYGDFEDSTAIALVKRPVAVYVEQVYRPGDWSGLGIGT